jgi:hypothetical protein
MVDPYINHTTLRPTGQPGLLGLLGDAGGFSLHPSLLDEFSRVCCKSSTRILRSMPPCFARTESEIDRIGLKDRIGPLFRARRGV